MEVIRCTYLQLPERSGQPEDAKGHVVEEQLSEIMNICVSAAQVASTRGEVTLRKSGP